MDNEGHNSGLDKVSDGCDDGENEPQIGMRRMGRGAKPLPRPTVESTTRRPVKDRWFYETVEEEITALMAKPGDSNSWGKDEKDDEACKDDEDKSFFFRCQFHEFGRVKIKFCVKLRKSR